MTNKYELAVIFHPDLEIDTSGAIGKLEKILADNKAEITSTDNWGKRKLAYPIKRQDHGIYVVYGIEMPSTNVGKLDSTLNITTEVIRHLIVKPGPEGKVPEVETKEENGEAEKES